MQSENFRMPAQSAANNLQQADLLSRAGRFDEAIPLYESSLANLESLNGMEAPELAECLQNLAEAYQSVARYEDSLRTNWRLVRIGEKILGRVHPDMVSMLLKIAETNEMMGKTDDALHIVESAIATAKQCMQADNPLAVRLIERHTYLVNLLRNQGAVRSQYDDPALYNPQVEAPPGLLPQTASEQPPEPQVHKQVLRQVQAQIQNQQQQQIQNLQQQQSTGAQAPVPAEGETAMQAFAREMLKDMPAGPGNRSAFSQSVKHDQHSGVNFKQVDLQEALALNPTLAQVPAPPERSNVNDPRPSYGTALAQRPESFEFDNESLEEEPYTAEAIASLTNRSKVNTRSNAKGRRLSNNEQSRIRTGRLFKDFGLPLIGVAILIGLVCYLFSGKPPEVKPAAVSKGQQTVYETPDEKKQLRLLGTEVTIVTASGATKYPFQRVKTGWGELLAALGRSAFEKQIWLEENLSAIKSETGVNYYRVGGPENLVVAKMNSLAAFAQSIFLRTGEYPRLPPTGSEAQFAYSSPFNGKGINISIITERSTDSDGNDIKLALEGGLHLGNEETNIPGYIGCYTALFGENVKTIKFYVRGCNRDGQFLKGDNDQIFVVSADSQKSFKPIIENKVKAPQRRTKKSKIKELKPAPEPVQVEPAKEISAVTPSQPTTVYIASENMLPLVLMHHLLPLILALATVLTYFRSRMVGFDISGEEVSSGSKIALIIAIILLCLTLASFVMQFIVFA